MIRVIGTELRRSNARLLALLLFLAGGIVLATSADWTRQWLMFSYYQASNMFLLAPLALAGGALLGRRERRTGATELLGSTGRPTWQQAVPTMAALAVAVTVVQVLTLVLGTARIGAAGGFLSAGGAVPALADISILIGASWTGLAAGRALPSPIVPPVLAAAALAAQVAASLTDPGSRVQSLSLLPQPPNALWESVSVDAVLGRLALGAGLAVGSLLLIAGTTWLSRVAGVAALVAGLALLAVITPPGTYARYQVNAEAQKLVCSDDTPQVCVTAVRAYELDEVTVAARRALTLLAKLPGAPIRAAEWRAGTTGDGSPDQFRGPAPTIEPGTVLFALGGYGAPSAADVTASILNGAGTTVNGCEPGDEVALGAAGAWLLGTDSLPLRDAGWPYPAETDEQIRAVVTVLRQLPYQEQVRRVTALRDAANACRTDDLRALLTAGRVS